MLSIKSTLKKIHSNNSYVRKGDMYTKPVQCFEIKIVYFILTELLNL